MKEESSLQKFKRNQHQLSESGSILCRVVSESMAPMIKVNDEVSVLKINEATTLKRFDIIVFWDGGRPLCHFFWGESHFSLAGGEKLYLTRSLKNPTFCDSPVSFGNILGKVDGVQMNLWHKLIFYCRFLWRSFW